MNLLSRTLEFGPTSNVPLDEKDDLALKVALDFLRRATTDVAFPLDPKAVPKRRFDGLRSHCSR
jgi:hypothetical protein